MNHNDWKKLSQIFDMVLTLPPEGRTDYIERVCGGDEELEQKIREMLARLEESDRFFEERIGKNEELIKELDSLISDKDRDEDFYEGKTIGRWEILELIGHGGMGRVYKVQRVDESGIKQTGALKIIHKSLLTPTHMERFRLEQHILSGLQHPNISGFVDSGITADRVPYMVMEFVEGDTILEYCNKQMLTIEQRLKLFITVCKAIQYAHKSLIVHRDLKPENILVTSGGRIKILDFGIAKLLDPDLYENSAIETQPGMRMLSLEYASPEQISGKVVTTSTDLYSLGVLLSKLLTGLHPFDLSNLSFKEVEKLVTEGNPIPASKRFSGVAEGSEKKRLADERAISSQEITRKLSGDIDAIIYKALHKDPERRYASVEALITDIERYQNNLPVFAQPDTFSYRAGKFIRRHKLAIASIAVIFLVLIGGIVATMWQAEQAKQNAEQAILEAQKAEAVRDFLIDIFEVSDPNLALGDTITAQELLDRGAARINSELADQPQIQAEMLGVMGEVYRQLGLFEKAEKLLEQSLRKQSSIHQTDSPLVAASLNRLGLLRYHQGDFSEAIQLLEQALAIREGYPETEPAELSEAQNNLATLYMENGQYEPADSLLRLAMDTRRTFDHPALLAESQTTLALLHYTQGNLDQAEMLYKEVLAIDKKYLEPNHPSLAETYHHLAQLYWSQGKLDQAESLFRDVIAIDKHVYGEDHPTVALNLNSLGLVLMDQGKFDEAEAAYLEAITIQETKLGKEHPDLTATYYNLGSMYSFTGQYERAEQMLRRVLAIDKKLFDDRHPNVGIDMASLGGVLIALGKYDESKELLAEALSIFEEVFPEGHPRIASVEVRMGQLAFQQGEYEKAETLLTKALPVAEATFNTPWKTAAAKSTLGQTLLALGRSDEAEPLLFDADLALSEVFNQNHSVVLATRQAIQSIQTQ